MAQQMAAARAAAAKTKDVQVDVPVYDEKVGRTSPILSAHEPSARELVGKSSTRLAQILTEEEIRPDDLKGLDGAGVTLLGTGAFGEVRLVTWRKTAAAAKVAHKEVTLNQKLLFLRELELMVRCRHPNIVQFLGYVDSPFVIVMEFLPKGDLRAYWRSRRVPVGHKTSICLDVLRALGYLHNRRPHKIVHRDVKPTNVLMTNSGIAKLTDFGLGRILGQEMSKHGCSTHGGSIYSAATAAPASDSKGGSGKGSRRPSNNVTGVVGTAPYMAPESSIPGPAAYDEKVDIYSAAVTFHELFEQSAFNEEMPFAGALTPPRISKIIREMGKTDPTARPSALDLVDRFEDTGLARPPAEGACCVVS